MQRMGLYRPQGELKTYSIALMCTLQSGAWDDLEEILLLLSSMIGGSPFVSLREALINRDFISLSAIFSLWKEDKKAY